MTTPNDMSATPPRDGDVDAIRARMAKITPGDWKDIITYDGFVQVESQVRIADRTPFVICGIGDMEETEAEDHYNAAFIAHAPEDMRTLLARIAALEAEYKGYRDGAQKLIAELRNGHDTRPHDLLAGDI